MNEKKVYNIFRNVDENKKESEYGIKSIDNYNKEISDGFYEFQEKSKYLLRECFNRVKMVGDGYTLLEDLISNILEILFPNYNIIKLRKIKFNYPAIDVGIENIGVQVTVRTDFDKIRDTINTFESKQLNLRYNKLLIIHFNHDYKEIITENNVECLISSPEDFIDKVFKSERDFFNGTGFNWEESFLKQCQITKELEEFLRMFREVENYRNRSDKNHLNIFKAR